MSTCSNDFWLSRLEKKKEQLAAMDDALIAVTTGAIDSYTLDTGQSRQTVTKQNLAVLERLIERLENQIATLETRIYGCGTHTGGPAW